MADDGLVGGILPREAGDDFQINRAVGRRFSHVVSMGPEEGAGPPDSYTPHPPVW